MIFIIAPGIIVYGFSDDAGISGVFVVLVLRLGPQKGVESDVFRGFK